MAPLEVGVEVDVAAAQDGAGAGRGVKAGRARPVVGRHQLEEQAAPRPLRLVGVAAVHQQVRKDGHLSCAGHNSRPSSSRCTR